MSTLPYFEVLPPAAQETPLVVEIPHAGLWMDAEALAFTTAPARSLARDADLHVDLIFEAAPDLGATTLRARASRYLLDLNRAEEEFDAEAVEGGGTSPFPRGLVWRLTTEGAPVLRERLPRAELLRRLELLYRPYHETLRQLLEAKRRRFGFAILLCAHSMPSRGRSGHLDTGAVRADLVPGSRGRTSAANRVLDEVDQAGQTAGFSIRHDDPYRGGHATRYYGRPTEHFHAVQVELSRALYLDEDRCQLLPAGLERVQSFASDLVGRLGALELPRWRGSPTTPA